MKKSNIPMENEIQFFNELCLKNCLIFGQIGLQIGWFFSQFLAATFLARNVSQIHFPFSREMREMCRSMQSNISDKLIFLTLGGICTPEYFKNGYAESEIRAKHFSQFDFLFNCYRYTLYLNSGLSSSRNHYGQR